jgi:uncharacterized membrane protein HdeD (DUF308 family)
MFTVSRDYAPPFGMITPFFIIGVVLYLFSTLSLLAVEPQNGHFDPVLVGVVHLFLLGFVMMVIFGAMAQLIPVVVEVGHFSVDLYYVIWPLLLTGTLSMVFGFWVSPTVLPYGGLLVLVSMLIYLYDTLMTLKRAENITLTVKTAVASNLFLTVGIIIGFVLSLSIGAGVEIDIASWLTTHAVMVLGGYVVLTIIGLSMILLPMFGLAHGFDDSSGNISFKLMVAGVILHLLSTTLSIDSGKFLAFLIMFMATLFYLKQIHLIYKVRARKEREIWANSMFFGYFSLMLAVIFGVSALFGGEEKSILLSGWFLGFGFVGFLITGHLFKIIPFLVWFERYAPLVGKEKVPMLHEMYPKRVSKYQFRFTAIGVVVVGVGLFFESNFIFKVGVTLLIIGSFFMLLGVKKMLSYGRKES